MMGKSYDFGETKDGNVGMSSSNRKAKKSKSKTPQRGLGVAQLEKLRLNGQFDIDLPYLNLKQKEEMGMQSVYSSTASSISVSSSLPTTASSASDQLYSYIDETVGNGDRHQSSDIIYGDRRSWTFSWTPANNLISFQQCAQPETTTHVSKQHVFKEEKIKKQRSSSSMESSTSQNSESVDTKELDLELRLSI